MVPSLVRIFLTVLYLNIIIRYGLNIFVFILYVNNFQLFGHFLVTREQLVHGHVRTPDRPESGLQTHHVGHLYKRKMTDRRGTLDLWQ